MTRTYKKHDTRKDELLDITQKLFYQKGYDRTTVEDIINAAAISKGAFYHHFSSKEDLLDNLVYRMSEKIVFEIRAIIEDPALNVLQKLHKATAAGKNIKVSNKELLKTYMKVIHSDQNLVLRHKLNLSMINLIEPLYTILIEQGVKENIFTTPSPRFAARMMITMGIEVQNMISKLFIELDEHEENEIIINQQIDLYENALERLLGAPKGSLDLVNRADIHAFRGDK